jgi:PiT family inorganic phosphate transporter
MISTSVLFSLVLVLIFCFAMTNGILDGGGIVSTVIATRVLEPLPALIIVAVCEVVGVFLLGHAVVRTVGLNLISFPVSAPVREVLLVLLSAMAGALAWNSTMWRFSLPTSSSHALLGGLVGVTWSHFGRGAVSWPVVIRVALGLAAVPVIAALISMLLVRLLYWAGQYLTPAVGGVIRGLHIVALAGIALVHGSNDGQKSLALVLLALLAFGGAAPTAHLPPWVGLICGIALGLGVVFGSRRTIQTVGRGLYRVQNLQGLCAELSTMVLVGVSSVAGYPVSSSHVMSSSVIGAGAAVRPKGIRWDLAGSIGMAWLFTIPAAGVLSAFLFYVVSKAL